MRVMVIVKASRDSEAGVFPEAEVLAELGQFNEALVQAGVTLAAEGLLPSSTGVRVRSAAGGHTLIAGPFSDATDLVAGFWLWQVRTLEEAIEWVKRYPAPASGTESEIEIRQVSEADDPRAESKRERVAQEKRQRPRLAATD